MSAITLVVDKDKKPQYKDYVSFLGNYKNGKRDECDNSSVGYSLSSSANSSSSEISELPTKSFNEYLKSYTNKKFQPVKPTLKENDQTTKPKSVKTELIIQVNNTNHIEDSMTDHPRVDDIAKIFEKTNQTNSKKKCQTRRFQQIQQKFDIKAENEVKIPINTLRLNLNESNQPKHDAQVKSSLINGKNNVRLQSDNLNQMTTNITQADSSVHNENLPKTLIANESFLSNYTKPVLEANQTKAINNQVSYNNSPKKLTSSAKIIVNETSSKKEIKEIISPIIKETMVINQSTPLTKEVQIPPPPPPPNNFVSNCVSSSNGTSLNKEIASKISSIMKENLLKKETVPIKSELQIKVSPPPSSPPTIGIAAQINGIAHVKEDIQVNIPPPPPPPPANFSPNPSSIKTAKTPQFHSTTLPRIANSKQAKQNNTIDRNDPRFKKVAYGALRNMYGAYHDKANDYLATLPKNRVKKGNGLDNIINSIAAQGGLEKLCGRAKVEDD